MLGYIRNSLLLGEMKRNQFKSGPELIGIQQEKLKDLVRFASKNVPHYRNLRLRSIDDLPSLPILEKKDIASNPESFLSKRHPRASQVRTSTSGSTGIPIQIYTSQEEAGFGMVLEVMQMTETGTSPLDFQARITHLCSKQSLLQKMGIFRCHYIGVQKPEKETMRILESIKPSVLCGYPSILLPLAHLNRGLRLKRIYAGGEQLGSNARKVISDSFGAKVLDRYGSMESSWIAWECEKGSLHIQSDQVIVEITDDDGDPVPQGKPGNIVVTPLWRRAMPFIRYSLGDTGAFGTDCACGRGLPVLKSIHGRQDDLIRLPSGRLRSARSLNLMDEIQGITSYQIIQEREDLFVFRFVPIAEGLSESAKMKISQTIQQGALGEEISVEFQETSSIERGRSGKIRTVISKVI